MRAGKNYEEEFASEIEKGKTGQVKNTPWGSSYAKTPKILHGKSCSRSWSYGPALFLVVPGLRLSAIKKCLLAVGYDREVKGNTAEERLDIRCAQRSDKFAR